ncbi:unnamed protein product [Oncorhynchus mykiss]|uniref:Reverse transcriptase domain-containing protein n=1 Tax=Oncorhynchus mykiss TaxID=8022 RepID=A0A060ZJN9_ONCMY|nr:unnamed protein product [Oncorhynchus mykiss]
MFKFFRNIRLREYFSSPNSDTSIEPVGCSPAHTPTPFRSKSYFIPPANRNHSIETYCRLVENDVGLLLKNKQGSQSFHNLPKNEKQALLDLQSDTSVLICPADKGGSVVLMDRTAYVHECHRQLLDNTFYKKLRSDPTSQFQNTILTALDGYLSSGQITKKEHAFLAIQHPKIATFYTLPKLHKNVTQPPGRTIVAGIDAVTAPLSTFVDFFIRPLAEQLPSFVKDTSSMISIIESLDPLPENTLLVAFDVESLYTNIPHEGGIEAMGHFLLHRDPNELPSSACIVTLAEIVLTHNYFMFLNYLFI